MVTFVLVLLSAVYQSINSLHLSVLS